MGRKIISSVGWGKERGEPFELWRLRRSDELLERAKNAASKEERRKAVEDLYIIWEGYLPLKGQMTRAYDAEDAWHDFFVDLLAS